MTEEQPKTTSSLPEIPSALFFIMLLIVSPAMAGTGTVTIFGTNVSNAQQNVTITDAPASITVTAWSVGGIKTFKVNVTNASDTLTFNLYNVTVGQVNEFKVNGTSINGYQGNSLGLVTFTRTQGMGNSTFNLAPAVQQGGYNTTWAYIQNLIVQTATTIYNVAIYNATQVQGNGSGLYDIVLANVTGLQAQQDAQNTSSANNNTNSQARDDMINSTKLNKTELNSTVDKNLSNYTNTPGFITSPYNATYDLKLTNVTAGSNITITWTGCPSACVAQINSTGGGGITSESDPLWGSSANQTKFNNAENITNKSIDTTLGTSDILYPSQNAVKSYVDAANNSMNALKYNKTDPVNVSAATGVLSNASLPLSAANISNNNNFSGTIKTSAQGYSGIGSLTALSPNAREAGIYLAGNNSELVLGHGNGTFGLMTASGSADPRYYLMRNDTGFMEYIANSNTITFYSLMFLQGLGAAAAGTSLILTAGNEIRPLLSSNKSKTNMISIQNSTILSSCDISKINIKSFDWIGDNQQDAGVDAAQVASVCPIAVNFATENTTIGGINFTKGDVISIRWATLTSLELQKIQEQQKQIDYLYQQQLNLTKP